MKCLHFYLLFVRPFRPFFSSRIRIHNMVLRKKYPSCHLQSRLKENHNLKVKFWYTHSKADVLFLEPFASPQVTAVLSVRWDTEQGDFYFYFLNLRYSKLLHLPPPKIPFSRECCGSRFTESGTKSRPFLKSGSGFKHCEPESTGPDKVFLLTKKLERFTVVKTLSFLTSKVLNCFWISKKKRRLQLCI